MATLTFKKKSIKSADGRTAFKLTAHGSVGPTTIASFERTLDAEIDNGEIYIVLDFSDLEYINSTGLGMLVQFHFSLQEEGGALAIIADDPKVVQVIELLGLQELLELRKTEAQALEVVFGKGYRLAGQPMDKPAAKVKPGIKPKPAPAAKPVLKKKPSLRKKVTKKIASRPAVKVKPSVRPKSPSAKLAPPKPGKAPSVRKKNIAPVKPVRPISPSEAVKSVEPVQPKIEPAKPVVKPPLSPKVEKFRPSPTIKKPQSEKKSESTKASVAPPEIKTKAEPNAEAVNTPAVRIKNIVPPKVVEEIEIAEAIEIPASPQKKTKPRSVEPVKVEPEVAEAVSIDDHGVIEAEEIEAVEIEEIEATGPAALEEISQESEKPVESAKAKSSSAVGAFAGETELPEAEIVENISEEETVETELLSDIKLSRDGRRKKHKASKEISAKEVSDAASLVEEVVGDSVQSAELIADVITVEEEPIAVADDEEAVEADVFGEDAEESSATEEEPEEEDEYEVGEVDTSFYDEDEEGEDEVLEDGFDDEGETIVPSARPQSTRKRLRMKDNDYPFLLRGIKRGYQTGAGFFEVLRGIDLEVEPGELVIIAGPSGSGKSTLLSVMGGLLKSDEGDMLIFGKNLAKMNETEVQEQRRLNMGYIFQNVYLMDSLTSKENISLALEIKGARNAPKGIEEKLLDMVDMGEFSHRLPSDLSGGQRQRVGIARALAGSPKVILADEPTAALDTKNALSVMKLLKDLAATEKIATIMVTHDMRLFQYADRVMNLANGKLREKHVKKKSFA